MNFMKNFRDQEVVPDAVLSKLFKSLSYSLAKLELSSQLEPKWILIFKSMLQQ